MDGEYATTSDRLSVRTRELMAESGISWRKAWRIAEQELGRPRRDGKLVQPIAPKHLSAWERHKWEASQRTRRENRMGPGGTAFGYGIVAVLITGVVYMYGEEIASAVTYILFWILFWGG
jgi:hypothetical protein